MAAAGGGHILESIKAIRVKIAPSQHDSMSVAFRNASPARRGAIAQTHVVLNWMQKLNNLTTSTRSNAEEVLNPWNKECPEQARVAGSKEVCRLNLLRCATDENRKILMEHTRKYGKNNAFTDEALTSKKYCQAGSHAAQPSERGG